MTNTTGIFTESNGTVISNAQGSVSQDPTTMQFTFTGTSQGTIPGLGSFSGSAMAHFDPNTSVTGTLQLGFACGTVPLTFSGAPVVRRRVVVTTFRRNGATGIAAMLVVVSVATTAGQSPGALTLPAAIAEALDHSPALQQPLDSVELAGIQSRLAASAFGLKVTPSLSTANGPTGGAARTAGVTVAKQLATGAQVFMNVSSYDLGGGGTHVRDAGYTVGFSQPLLRGFGQTATAGVANAKRAPSASADRDVTVARSALVVEVTSRYFAVVKQQRLSAAAIQASDRAIALKTASAARTQAGLATELDVLRADVQASQMAASVAAANAALDSARDQLTALIGRPLSGDPLVLAEPDPAVASADLEHLPQSLDELVQLAVTSRLEIAEARDRVGDATRAANVARWNTLPPVSLDVSYTQRGLGSLSGEVLNALVGGVRVGLTTSYSLDRSAESRGCGRVTRLGERG